MRTLRFNDNLKIKAPVLFPQEGDDEIRLGGLLCDTGHERCGFYAALLTDLRYGRRKEGAIGLRLFLGDYLDDAGMQSEIAPEFVESLPRRGGMSREIGSFGSFDGRQSAANTQYTKASGLTVLGNKRYSKLWKS
ncbi:hypothetical protein AVKW3434_17215 [Acidovorax sp. SUPP3434]|uniref:hypothetical protein n=1 Tax=Acidovorax sp. SUPP3434 TaxID=2920880 RepID=UPI0023DE3C9F|nr:hypothetical protein [Acidovorax sp. SUPP3434]GKT01154.1 hypothetical protein AVKW3434_17215 [Acidovorax sp. SUPP3434]